MNTNLTISEIVTIAVVILLVFGPHRLPEMARRAGQLIGKMRDAASALRTELTTEYDQVTRPFKDIESELKAAKDELGGTLRDAGSPGRTPDEAPPDDRGREQTEAPPEGPGSSDDRPSDGGDGGDS